MVSGVQRADVVRLAKEAICIVAPPIASILLFQKAQSYLASQTRSSAFFSATFVSTLLTCRLHQYAWKTSLAASLVLTWLARHIATSYNVRPEAAHIPEVLKRHLPVDVLDIPNYVLSGVSSVDLLREKKIRIQPKSLHRAVLAWLGKGPSAVLVPEDVMQLQKYICYRSLKPAQRQLVRQDLYNKLHPLLTKEMTIPGMTTCQGGQIVLRKASPGDALIVRTCGHSVNLDIYIMSNGSIKFEYLDSDHPVFTILEENYESLHYNSWGRENTQQEQLGYVYVEAHNNKWLPWVDRRKAFHYAMACMELLVFKSDQIATFLAQGPSRQAHDVFDRCQSFLDPHGPVTTVSRRFASASDQFAHLGPIGNRIVAAENSWWHCIPTQDAAGVVSLCFEKRNRTSVGQRCERLVSLSKGVSPNQLRVVVTRQKEKQWSEGQIYLLERRTDQVYIAFQGREWPLFGDTSEDNIKDIFETLMTLTDIVFSPETVLVNEPSQEICTMQGNPIPLERFKYISSSFQSQGCDDETELLSYSAFGGDHVVVRAGREIEYRGARKADHDIKEPI